MLHPCTDIFVVRPAAYATRALRWWLTRHALWLAVPPVACGCLAVLLMRWEWLVVGMAILLLVYPMVLAMVYIRYGLPAADTGVATAPMSVEFADRAVFITCYTSAPASESASDTDNAPLEPRSQVTVNYTDLGGVALSDNGLLLRLDKRGPRHVFVPRAALADAEDAILERLRQNGMIFA